MNKNIHYCFVVLVLLIYGCVSSKKDAELDLKFKYTISTNDTIVDKFNYDELIDSIFIVRLETNESCLIDRIDKLVFYENTCFILDDKMGVYAFSMNGDFIQKVGGEGRAPGEYISCFDMSISDSLLFIYDNHGGEMHCYNAGDYSYIDSYSQLNRGGEAIVKGDYVFGKGWTEDEKPNLKCKFLIQDNDDENTLLRSESDEFDLRMGNRVVTSNRNHFWIDPLRCKVYELNSKGGITPHFKLNEPEFILTEDELRSVTNNNEIKKLGKILYFNNYYETLNHQIVNYSKDNEQWALFHNKEQNKLYNTKMKLRYYQPFYNIDGVYNDFFVKTIGASLIEFQYNIDVKYNGAFTGIYSGLNELKNVNEDDNPILFFARFK